MEINNNHLLKHNILAGVAVCLVFLWFSQGRVAGQGYVEFSNRNSSGIDAPVTFADGRGVGEGFQAQLFGGPAGTPKESLSPLIPTTVFMFGTPAREKYIQPVSIQLANIKPGEQASFFMRAYNGGSWEQASFRGESDVFSLTVSPVPWALIGLHGFTVHAVPEPNPPILFALGLTVCCLGRICRRSVQSN